MSDTDTTAVSVPQKQNVLFFEETTAPTVSSDKSTQSLGLTRFAQARGANALVVRIDTARLYDAPVGDSSNIVRARELLKEASDHFGDARKAGTLIAADRSLQRAQKILPNLFALRSIGDGFAVIVNSIYVGFTNLRGKPMNPKQIDVVWRVLRNLRNGPALSFDQGIQAVEELEESGLEVDPPELESLLGDSESSDDE